MAVFILTPRDEQNPHLENLLDKYATFDRVERIESLRSIRLSDEVAGDLAERVEKCRWLGCEIIASAAGDLPLTGVTILNAELDAQAALESEFPNHRVNHDMTIVMNKSIVGALSD